MKGEQGSKVNIKKKPNRTIQRTFLGEKTMTHKSNLIMQLVQAP